MDWFQKRSRLPVQIVVNRCGIAGEMREAAVFKTNATISPLPEHPQGRDEMLRGTPDLNGVIAFPYKADH